MAKVAKPKAAGKRGGGQRPFPACSIEEALELPTAIQTHSSGLRIRRLTLFDQMKRSPDSSASRMLIVNAGRYGLIKGGYQAEFLELTPEGAIATNPETAPRERAKVLIELGIFKIESFKALYDRFCDNRLPNKAVLEDALKEVGISAAFVSEGVETFIVNAKFVGILRSLSGAERLIKVDQVIDELSGDTSASALNKTAAATADQAPQHLIPEEKGVNEWAGICFYISPIGDDGSEHRKHADLFLGSIVEPALEGFKLKVVRADKISEPGIITRQILDHILNARLVVADLSFHNPNVFYELCLRHAARLPVVQVIRASDRIPFDLSQSRTIKIDTTDIFSLVPQIETYRTEIAAQVRRALENPDAVDNPVSTYYPKARLVLE